MRLKFPQVNQVILIFIVVQFMFTVAVSLSGPFFAVFVLEDIRAVAGAIGFLSALYWLVKSVLQLPIARWIDRNHGEVDDYYSLLLGVSITTVGIFLFYGATELWHLFAIQALIAVGDAFSVPPLYAIFIRHIDKGSEGYEWALQSSFAFGGGGALGGALAGILVGIVGIRALFLINGTLMLVGLVILLALRPYIRPRAPHRVERGVFIEHKRV